VTQIKSFVISTDDYYPFGLTFNSYTRENSVPNQYKYNGKELQDKLNLGWLDYGARMYMPEIGRWGTVDPLSEVSRRWSPYTYCYNNPLRFVDPDGMFGDFYNELGEHLGSDGIDDGKVYQTTDAAYTEHVDGEAASKTGGPDYDALKADGETNFIGKTNEFGLIQLTRMGNEHISNNAASEDTYSYTDASGNEVAAGQHGDDWVTPQVGAAFNGAVNRLAESNPDLNVVVNDGSAFNPLHNLDHDNHFTGESIDMKFITANGAGSNNISNLSQSNTTLNGKFVTELKTSGFTRNFSDQGTIPGTVHRANHANHLHTAYPGSTSVTGTNLQQAVNAQRTR